MLECRAVTLPKYENTRLGHKVNFASAFFPYIVSWMTWIGFTDASSSSSKERSPPNFRPMSIVAKRSPISATAEHLFTHLVENFEGRLSVASTLVFSITKCVHLSIFAILPIVVSCTTIWNFYSHFQCHSRKPFLGNRCKTVCPILSDRCPVCLSVCLPVLSILSVTLVYCGQTVGWIKMKLGMEVGLGLGHIVLDGDLAPLPKGHSPHFSAHVYYGQAITHLSYC